MKTTKIKIALATMTAAVAVTAFGGTIGPTGALAAAPKTVKAGSTGNAKLDDICKQMADLINDEIGQGNNEESNGNYGEANAWYDQARDHIARSQAAGCVMSIRVPPNIGHFHGQLTANVAELRLTASVPRGSQRKKISGHATPGKGNFDQAGCDRYATDVNTALGKSDAAAQANDPGAAQGWREHANDLLAAGRKGGCTWTAAIRAGTKTKVGSPATALVR